MCLLLIEQCTIHFIYLQCSDDIILNKIGICKNIRGEVYQKISIFPIHYHGNRWCCCCILMNECFKNKERSELTFFSSKFMCFLINRYLPHSGPMKLFWHLQLSSPRKELHLPPFLQGKDEQGCSSNWQKAPQNPVIKNHDH